MIEVHPFGDFVPKDPRYLLIGSFVTKPMNNYEWFYANGRNQFWPILEEVYDRDLKNKNEQIKLFKDLHMALTDIIYSCERKKNSNLDINLFNITYNIEAIRNIVKVNKIRRIYFTSRFVESIFRRKFKDISMELELVCLPSPSPRFATMSKAIKIEKYKTLLPHLDMTYTRQ